MEYNSMSSSDIRHLLNLLESITLMELTDKVKNQQFDRLTKENPNFNPDEIKKYIDSWDAFAQGFPSDKKDITTLSLEEIVKLIRDTSFKSSLKGRDTPFHKKPEINRDMDVVYNKNGLEILKGDMKEKCIMYGKNSKWCISRNDAQNMFYTYRMRLDEPAFYFVFDTDRPETDPLHRFVIHINKNGNYKLTDFDNIGDKDVSWNEIEQMQPKLRGLQKLFVSVPLSSEERTDYEKYKDSVDLRTYQNYSLEEKYKYIKFGHELDSDQQDATPAELISIYAKGMPTRITNKTWNRLKSGDKRKIISDVLDEKNDINPVAFSRDVLEKPWYMSGFPDEVVDQAHKKTTKSPYMSYKYAEYIINKTGDISQVPDIIVNGIATDSYYSYHYAGYIINKLGDISDVPDIILKGIATDSSYSYNYANNIIDKTGDISDVPDIILKGIATNSKKSSGYARYIINRTGNISDVPDIIVKSIATDSANSYIYASDIIDKTGDISDVPDIILKGIATNSRHSSYYANNIIDKTGDISDVPDIIVKSIKQDDESYESYKKLVSQYTKTETLDLSRLKTLSGIK